MLEYLNLDKKSCYVVATQVLDIAPGQTEDVKSKITCLNGVVLLSLSTPEHLSDRLNALIQSRELIPKHV